MRTASEVNAVAGLKLSTIGEWYGWQHMHMLGWRRTI